jgi:hypothetical protein
MRFGNVILSGRKRVRGSSVARLPISTCGFEGAVVIYSSWQLSQRTSSSIGSRITVSYSMALAYQKNNLGYEDKYNRKQRPIIRQASQGMCRFDLSIFIARSMNEIPDEYIPINVQIPIF